MLRRLRFSGGVVYVSVFWLSGFHMSIFWMSVFYVRGRSLSVGLHIGV
jgi:hypothetical protein